MSMSCITAFIWLEYKIKSHNVTWNLCQTPNIIYILSQCKNFWLDYKMIKHRYFAKRFLAYLLVYKSRCFLNKKNVSFCKLHQLIYNIMCLENKIQLEMITYYKHIFYFVCLFLITDFFSGVGQLYRYLQMYLCCRSLNVFR